MITKIAIATFYVGMILFYSLMISDTNFQSWMYYIWDKSVFLLVVAAPSTPDFKKHELAWSGMALFAIIRLAWELISAVSGWNVNNTKIVGVLFIIICTILLLITLSEWQRITRSKS